MRILGHEIMRVFASLFTPPLLTIWRRLGDVNHNSPWCSYVWCHLQWIYFRNMNNLFFSWQWMPATLMFNCNRGNKLRNWGNYWILLYSPWNVNSIIAIAISCNRISYNCNWCVYMYWQLEFLEIVAIAINTFPHWIVTIFAIAIFYNHIPYNCNWCVYLYLQLEFLEIVAIAINTFGKIIVINSKLQCIPTWAM